MWIAEHEFSIGFEALWPQVHSAETALSIDMLPGNHMSMLFEEQQFYDVIEEPQFVVLPHVNEVLTRQLYRLMQMQVPGVAVRSCGMAAQGSLLLRLATNARRPLALDATPERFGSPRRLLPEATPPWHVPGAPLRRPKGGVRCRRRYSRRRSSSSALPFSGVDPRAWGARRALRPAGVYRQEALCRRCRGLRAGGSWLLVGPQPVPPRAQCTALLQSFCGPCRRGGE